MARSSSVRRQWISQYDDIHNDLHQSRSNSISPSNTHSNTKKSSNNPNSNSNTFLPHKRMKHAILCASVLFIFAVHLRDSKSTFEVMDSVISRSLRQRNLSCNKRITISANEASKMPYSGQLSKVYSPPSHIQLCSELLHRNSVAVEAQKEHEEREVEESGAFSTFVVNEASHVCTDWEHPHSSLMEIFASSVVAYVGERFGIEYRHNCHKSKSLVAEDVDFDVTTIQQIIAQLPMPINENKLGVGQVVHELCQSCLEETNPLVGPGSEDTHHCLLFPKIDGVHTDVVREERMFKGAPEVVVEEEALDVDGNVVHTALEAVLPLVRNRLYHAALDWASRSHIPGRDPTAGAVIYIDPGSSMAVPFHLYQDYIPLEATHVSILTGPKCVRGSLPYSSSQQSGKDISCLKYVTELETYLQKHYKIEVKYEIVSSTAASVSRMMMTKTLVCAPGTVTCLLPALAKEQTKTAIILESQENTSTFHWFTSLGRTVPQVKVVPLTVDQLRMDAEQMNVELEYASWTVEDSVSSSVEGEQLDLSTIDIEDKLGDGTGMLSSTSGSGLSMVSLNMEKGLSSNTIDLERKEEASSGEKTVIPPPMIKSESTEDTLEIVTETSTSPTAPTESSISTATESAEEEVAFGSLSDLNIQKNKEIKYEPKESIIFQTKDDYLQSSTFSHVRESSSGKSLPALGGEVRNFVAAKPNEAAFESAFRANTGGQEESAPAQEAVISDVPQDAAVAAAEMELPKLEELKLPDPVSKTPDLSESDAKEEARMKEGERGFL